MRIAEPHPFVETDAVALTENGYAITVHGALPYVGREQKIRIDRALRFSAEATLLDAEPAVPEAIDRESDLLEPSRRVGERLDVEGRMRGRRRRGTPRSTSNGAHVDPMSIEEAIEGGQPDYGRACSSIPAEAPAGQRERHHARSGRARRRRLRERRRERDAGGPRPTAAAIPRRLAGVAAGAAAAAVGVPRAQTTRDRRARWHSRR